MKTHGIDWLLLAFASLLLGGWAFAGDEATTGHYTLKIRSRLSLPLRTAPLPTVRDGSQWRVNFEADRPTSRTVVVQNGKVITSAAEFDPNGLFCKLSIKGSAPLTSLDPPLEFHVLSRPTAGSSGPTDAPHLKSVSFREDAPLTHVHTNVNGNTTSGEASPNLTVNGREYWAGMDCFRNARAGISLADVTAAWGGHLAIEQGSVASSGSSGSPSSVSGVTNKGQLSTDATGQSSSVSTPAAGSAH